MKFIAKIISSIIVLLTCISMISVEAVDYEYTDIMDDLFEGQDVPEDVPDSKNAASSKDTLIYINSLESSGEALPAPTNDNVDPNAAANTATVEFTNFNIVDSYNYIKNKNSDTVAWLYMPEIGSYPIMYSGDNAFYLNHDSMKYQAENGSIFMNKDSGGNFKDVALIHGHHLKSGKMFGSLKKYKDAYFFQNNDLVEVFDGENLRYYRPFSVFYYQDGTEYIYQNFDDPEQKENYFKDIQDRSFNKISSDYTPNLKSDILILSTCDYEFENCRLGIAYYLVAAVPYSE